MTTASAFKVYNQVLTDPGAISAKFGSWFFALLAALTFAVATLGINVVANFVSPAYDFANVAPKTIDFKKGGYIAAGIALILYPIHPWTHNLKFVSAIGATMGPLFGIILVDYFLLRKQEVDVDALYTEDADAPYHFQGGWNYKAIGCALFGSIFSSFLPTFGGKTFASWGPYGWFLGVIIAGISYFAINGGKSPYKK